MFRLFISEAPALKRAEELTKQTNIQHVVLHKFFGDAHRYVVGYWTNKANQRRFKVCT